MNADYVAVNLANGQLPSTDTVAYTVPVDKAVLLTSIMLANRSSSAAIAVRIGINFGTGVRLITPPLLELAPGFLYEHDHSLALPTGATVIVYGATPAQVDYIISGVIA